MWGDRFRFDRPKNKHILRSDIEDAEIEQAERLKKLDEAVGQLKALLVKSELMAEGYWGGRAEDYGMLAEMPADVLIDPDFWRKFFSDENRTPQATSFGIFSALPAEAHANKDIYRIFVQQRDFSLSFVPPNVAARLDRDELVTAWRRMDLNKAHPSYVPWEIFPIDDQRRLIFRFIALGHFLELEKQRPSFIDKSITAKEWQAIAKNFYSGRPDMVFDRIKWSHAVEYFHEIFSHDELREVLRKPPEFSAFVKNAEPIFLDLSLPILHTLGFDSVAIAQWKQRHESSKVGQLAAGSEQFDQMPHEDRGWFLRTLSGRKDFLGGKYADFIAKDLPKIVAGMPAGAVPKTLEELQRFLDKTYEASEKEVIDGFVKPLIASQGPSTFRTLDTMQSNVDVYQGFEDRRSVFNLLFDDVESLKVLRSVMSKTGARFQDFSEFYLSLRLNTRDPSDWKISSSTHRMGLDGVALEAFLDAKVPWVVSAYLRFETALQNGARPKETARAIAGEVREDVDMIAEGTWPEKGMDDYRAGLLTHVFPPAMGVSREEYGRIVSRRTDRQDDVPIEFDTLQGKEVAFVLGKWELEKGAKFETAPWGMITSTIDSVNKKRVVREGKEAPETIVITPARVVEIGRAMLGLLSGSDEPTKRRALEDAYALFLLSGGAKLPEVVTGREEANRLREWSQEAMRDTIDIALRSYRETDPTRFEQEVKKALARSIPDKAKKGIAKQIIGVMGSPALDAEATNARVKEILARAGLVYEGDMIAALLPIVEGIDDRIAQENAIESAIFKLLEDASGGAQAGKISSVIVSKILGGDSDSMRRELDKWQFNEGVEGGEIRKVTFAISKKRLHSVVGLNMGVCVAVDDKLWNKPEFMNAIMFGDDGVARGGMHYEIVQDGRRRYLSLPGINPSVTMLREVKPEKVLHEMLEFAKASARAIGAKSILIPINSVIFSNREEFHGLIKSMNLPTMGLQKPHQFSYSPFSYEWQEAYVLEC